MTCVPIKGLKAFYLLRVIHPNTFICKKVCEHIAKHYKRKIEPNGYKGQVVVYDRGCCLMYKEELDDLLGPDASTIVIIVEQIVNGIDGIVKMVRSNGWKDTTEGKKNEKKALRQVT